MSAIRWQSDDVIPGWFDLLPQGQRLHLGRLLSIAPGREQLRASRRLHASPWPSTIPDASARCADVCELLEEDQ